MPEPQPTDRSHYLPEYSVESGRMLPVKYTGESGALGLRMHHDPADSLSGKDQIARLLDILARRRWIVLACFGGLLAVMGIYSLVAPARFEASSYVTVNLGRVQVDLDRGLPTSLQPSDTGFELFARNDRTLNGEIRLLEISDQLAQRVMTRLQESGGEGLPGYAGESLSSIRSQVRFVPEPGSINIIRFNGISSDPVKAARLANLYAEEYTLLTKEASRAQTIAVREALEEKENEQREELNTVEEQIKQFQQSGALGLEQESSRLTGLIATVETQRDDARIELQVERAALESFEEELARINPQLAQRIASGVERRIEILQTELAKEEDALAKIILENPDLRERNTNAVAIFDDKIEQLRAEIDSLSMQYVSEVSAAGGISGSADGLNYVANLRQQIAEKRVNVSRMQARVEVLDRRLRGYQAALRNLPDQSMELTQLERMRTRVEMVYQNTVTQLQEANVREESEPGYAQIIRRATAPNRAVFPNTLRNLILGAFFGLLLGLSLAITVEKLDNRIYQSEQLRQMGFKEIGIIPNLKPTIEKEYGGKAFVDVAGQQVATSIIALHNPVSAATEAYRYVRANMHFGPIEFSMRTILITSPGVGEGKSTTAANLAVVMAQTGKKTLLVDADLRRPKLHRMFGIEHNEGLFEYLTGKSAWNQDDWATDVPNLSILPAGKAFAAPQKTDTNGKGLYDDGTRTLTINPSDLLASDMMHSFLAQMRSLFDVVIIDSPPILAAADAALMSTQCDATIVVARVGVTKEGELNLTIETLEDVGASITGILLNGFDISMAFGHMYKYQHYSKYGRFSKYSYQASDTGSL